MFPEILPHPAGLVSFSMSAVLFYAGAIHFYILRKPSRCALCFALALIWSLLASYEWMHAEALTQQRTVIGDMESTLRDMRSGKLVLPPHPGDDPATR